MKTCCAASLAAGFCKALALGPVSGLRNWLKSCGARLLILRAALPPLRQPIRQRRRRIPAAPWESVWREKDRLLFGRKTQEVRDCYREWGIAAERDGHEPEDHLGLELAFILFLVQNMGGVIASSQGQSPEAALAAFMDGHILAWAGDCLKKTSECASTVFYREMSALCCLLLGNVRALVQE